MVGRTWMIALLLMVCCSAAQGDVLKIGVIAPLTGRGSEFGVQVKDGVEIALAASWPRSKLVPEILYQDSKCEPTAATKAYHYPRAGRLRTSASACDCEAVNGGRALREAITRSRKVQAFTAALLPGW